MSGLFAHWNSDRKMSGPIGIHISGGDNSSLKESDPDFFPDPFKFNIKKYKQVGRFLITFINYPNCINYEGNKILVFENCTIDQLNDQKFIDPHFIESKKYYYPI